MEKRAYEAHELVEGGFRVCGDGEGDGRGDCQVRRELAKLQQPPTRCPQR